MFFDPSQVEDVSPQGSFTPLKEGWYRAMIDGALLKPTQSGGHRVAVQMTVLDTVGRGRKLFGSFNIQNPSAEAQRIGQGQFKRFLAAVGITTGFNVDDAELGSRLKDKVVYAFVTEVKNFKTGEPDNEVKDYADKPKAQGTTQAPKAQAKKNDLDGVPF